MSVRKVNKQAGFSLIELMIVVAIIGILATVAAPNFKRFMAQSKQGEAKQNLAGYYQAQKAFFDQWNVYPGQFSAAGFKPSGLLNYRITAANNALGIAALTNYPGTAANGGNVVGSVTTAATPAQQMTYYPLDLNITATVPQWQESNMASSSTAVGCAVGASGTPSTTGLFTACAAAQHAGVNVAQDDTWEINQNKIVLNRTVGIP